MRLIVVEKDFENLRVLKPASPAEVTMTDAAFERYLVARDYCEKDQCSPKVVVRFVDLDGESIRIRPYSGSGTPLWRNSRDIRTKDVTPKKRQGVLYWGHFSRRAKVL